MHWSLPLSALRGFEAAARRGTFREAADELALTPSAVSHAVRKLEQTLGTKLFERDGRLVRLTADGQILLRHVSLGFGEMQRGIEIVSGRGPAPLRLHCAPSFATLWLMPRLAAFLGAAPGVTVRLSASTSYADFAADGFDADIVYGKPERPGLAVLGLGEEELTPLCAPGLASRLRQPADLAQVPLIDSDNKRFRWADWGEANGLPPWPPAAMRFDRSFMAIAAAADGLGVALDINAPGGRRAGDRTPGTRAARDHPQHLLHRTPSGVSARRPAPAAAPAFRRLAGRRTGRGPGRDLAWRCC